jgi:hypothetical protein
MLNVLLSGRAYATFVEQLRSFSLKLFFVAFLEVDEFSPARVW